MEIAQNGIKKVIFLLFGFSLFTLPLIKFFIFGITATHPDRHEKHLVKISPGVSPNEVTRILLNHGIIANGKKFIWLGKLGRFWKFLKAGEYRLSPDQSPFKIFH